MKDCNRKSRLFFDLDLNNSRMTINFSDFVSFVLQIFFAKLSGMKILYFLIVIHGKNIDFTLTVQHNILLIYLNI